MSRQKVSTECRKTVSSHCHKKVLQEWSRSVSTMIRKGGQKFQMVSMQCRKDVPTTILKDVPTIRIYRMVVLLSALSKKVYAPIRQVIFVKKKLRQVFVQRLCGMIPTMNGMRRFLTVHMHQSGMPSTPNLAALQQISFSLIP